jgi:hypothetical protein
VIAVNVGGETRAGVGSVVSSAFIWEVDMACVVFSEVAATTTTPAFDRALICCH